MSDTMTALRDHFAEKAVGQGSTDDKIMCAKVAMDADRELYNREQQKKWDEQTIQNAPTGMSPKKLKKGGAHQ